MQINSFRIISCFSLSKDVFALLENKYLNEKTVNRKAC
jgi:hypothetical protein